MTTAEIIASIISALCMVITAILAWVSIYKTNRVEVKFSGTPLDKKEFDQAMTKNEQEHARIFKVMGDENRATEGRATERMNRFEESITERLDKSEESRRNLHRDIDAISQRVAAIDERTQMTGSQVALLSGKLDRLIERKS